MTPSSNRRLDPTGRRALFETPVTAAPDTLRAGQERTGKAALFSTGPPAPGTVLVSCSSCRVRTRVGLGDVAVRLASFSLYLPLLKGSHPHRIKCPGCHQTTWCHIGWND